jgi:ribose transport system permease protein
MNPASEVKRQAPAGSEPARFAAKPPKIATAAEDVEQRRGRGLISEFSTALVLFAISAALIVGSRAISPAFGTWNQAVAILVLSSVVMAVAFGQQMVILIGGLDLSVASIMSLGGVLLFAWLDISPTALLWGTPVVLAITGLIGALSGIGVAFLRIPPFIMTLAMGIIVYSAALGITGGSPGGRPSPVLTALFAGRIFGIPPVLYLMAAFTAMATVLQTRSVLGRMVYALGTNPAAAYIAGLPVRRITIICFALSGAAAGFAGILMIGFTNGATLIMGESYLVPSIAAVVVGGTSIIGGRGHYLGAVGGALLLTTFSTVINALGIAEAWRIILYGAVILIALLLLREELRIWVARQYAALTPQRLVHARTWPTRRRVRTHETQPKPRKNDNA